MECGDNHYQEHDGIDPKDNPQRSALPFSKGIQGTFMFATTTHSETSWGMPAPTFSGRRRDSLSAATPPA
jgi:hypothetical protein